MSVRPGGNGSAWDELRDAAGDQEPEALLGELGLGARPRTPPPPLRERLLAEISRTGPEGSFPVAPGVVAVRTGDAAWRPTPLAGIESKLLHRGGASGRTTRLLRFAAGSRYPDHRHAAAEEIFVLEGSLWVNGVRLVAGDYCRSEPGTEERGTWSETGGLAIVVSSDRDAAGAAV